MGTQAVRPSGDAAASWPVVPPTGTVVSCRPDSGSTMLSVRSPLLTTSSRSRLASDFGVLPLSSPMVYAAIAATRKIPVANALRTFVFPSRRPLNLVTGVIAAVPVPAKLPQSPFPSLRHVGQVRLDPQKDLEPPLSAAQPSPLDRNKSHGTQARHLRACRADVAECCVRPRQCSGTYHYLSVCKATR